jgi:hypothetical protein
MVWLHQVLLCHIPKTVTSSTTRQCHSFEMWGSKMSWALDLKYNTRLYNGRNTNDLKQPSRCTPHRLSPTCLFHFATRLHGFCRTIKHERAHRKARCMIFPKRLPYCNVFCDHWSETLKVGWVPGITHAIAKFCIRSFTDFLRIFLFELSDLLYWRVVWRKSEYIGHV